MFVKILLLLEEHLIQIHSKIIDAFWLKSHTQENIWKG